MARALKQIFVNELKNGKFQPILQAVLDDDTLDLELRGDRVIIYYRGGKLLTLKEEGTLESLDKKYQQDKTILKTIPSFENIEDYIQQAKKIVDYYVIHKKNHLGEKDIQQMIIRENNYSPIDKDTDFFIIDTEYEENSSEGRFDMIALQWNSTASDHRYKKVELAFIEVKQGFKSVGSTNGKEDITKPGLLKHFQDYKKFVTTVPFEDFKNEMLIVFKQKKELGLIPNAPSIENIKDFRIPNETKFYVILANYKPASDTLMNELDAMDKAGITDCLFFTSSFCGYGLYKEGIKTQDEIKNIIKRNKSIK